MPPSYTPCWASSISNVSILEEVEVAEDEDATVAAEFEPGWEVLFRPEPEAELIPEGLPPSKMSSAARYRVSEYFFRKICKKKRFVVFT